MGFDSTMKIFPPLNFPNSTGNVKSSAADKVSRLIPVYEIDKRGNFLAESAYVEFFARSGFFASEYTAKWRKKLLAFNHKTRIAVFIRPVGLLIFLILVLWKNAFLGTKWYFLALWSLFCHNK